MIPQLVTIVDTGLKMKTICKKKTDVEIMRIKTLGRVCFYSDLISWRKLEFSCDDCKFKKGIRDEHNMRK